MCKIHTTSMVDTVFAAAVKELYWLVGVLMVLTMPFSQWEMGTVHIDVVMEVIEGMGHIDRGVQDVEVPGGIGDGSIDTRACEEPAVESTHKLLTLVIAKAW